MLNSSIHLYSTILIGLINIIIFDTTSNSIYTRTMNDFKLTITHYRILETVLELNKIDFYPNNEGIFKILSGRKDDESIQFKDLKTYSTLISYSSKRICSLTLVLYRHKYLEKKYDPNTNELYFKITKLGEDSLIKYSKKVNFEHNKKEVIEKPTIVKII